MDITEVWPRFPRAYYADGYHQIVIESGLSEQLNFISVVTINSQRSQPLAAHQVIPLLKAYGIPSTGWDCQPPTEQRRLPGPRIADGRAILKTPDGHLSIEHECYGNNNLDPLAVRDKIAA